MKLTKTKLKQIIKEEIAGLVSEGERHPDEPWSDKSLEALAYDQTAINTVKDALEKVLSTIEDAYSSLADEETQAQFEEHLLKNIQLYIKKWQAERGPEAPASLGTEDHPPGFPELSGQHSIRDYGE